MGTKSAQGRNKGTSDKGASTTETASSTLTTGPMSAFASGAISENVPKAGIVMGNVANCEHNVTEIIPATADGTPSSPRAKVA